MLFITCELLEYEIKNLLTNITTFKAYIIANIIQYIKSKLFSKTTFDYYNYRILHEL